MTRVLGLDLPILALFLSTVPCRQVSFNAALSACERAGLWQLAVQLLAEMKERNSKEGLEAEVDLNI